MKTPEQITEDTNWIGELDKHDINEIYQCMREYAREVLRDYDNWKAHKTPELVERYITEKDI